MSLANFCFRLDKRTRLLVASASLPVLPTKDLLVQWKLAPAMLDLHLAMW